MALVSYDVSDASDNEDDEDVPAIPKSKIEVAAEPEKKEGVSSDNVLFSILPTPKVKPTVLDSDLSKRLLFNKPTKSNEKSKKSIQISVPSLSDFEEDLPRPTTKKVAPSSKGSGLFAVLPPPKHTGMAATLKLMPDSLKKSAPAPKPVAKIPAKYLKKPVVSAPVVEDEEDSDEDGAVDFFSLQKPEEPVVISEDLFVPPLPEAPEPQTDSNFISIDPDNPEIGFYGQNEYDDPNFEPEKLELDEEAMHKLCGGNKRKRTAIQAELIDVAEKDVVPDKDEWLMKALTDEKRTRSHKKSGGPSSQQKRKHQITYLAFQAKEQEQELQNQWANNRMTKKQTQSKYGF